MRPVVALAAKDLRLLLRQKADLFFAFGFPVLMAVFFGLVFSGEGGKADPLEIAVHDEDGSEESRAFVDALAKAPEVDVLRAESREAAVDLVRRGKRVAYAVVLRGYGEAALAPLGGKPARVEVGADPARQADAAMVQGILTRHAFERISSRFPSPGGARFEPFAIERASVAVARAGPTNAFEVTFPQGIVWGIMGAAAAFGISLVSERTHGTLQRLLAGPITRAGILGGKALACFATTTAVAVALLALGMVVFGVRPDSWLALAAAILASSTGFVGLMMLLSALGKTEASASGIGWAVLVVLAMIGGGMVPLFAMPGWMQTLSHASPVKWSILAFEGAIWRDFGAAEMLLPCAILVAFGVAGFLVGSVAFRRSV
jgi:ABC-2 type transport system permease protein